MSHAKPKRRWWQFSLRSVLLLTLAVALWLGYEVRQARQVERAIAALSDLGGVVESESTGWSLLRLCGLSGYGQRIIRAGIPGTAVDEALALLAGLPGLSEVEVGYDGTYDPTPSWQRINGEINRIKVRPVFVDLVLLKPPEAGDEAVPASSLARLARIKGLVSAAYPDARHVNAVLEQCSQQHDRLLWSLLDLRYDIRAAADGTLAELLTSCPRPIAVPDGQRSFALLIVENRCVGLKGFATSPRANQVLRLEDLNHDGLADLGFQDTVGDWGLRPDGRVRRLPGDARDWLGVYRIERDGFQSLLDEDKSDFP